MFARAAKILACLYHRPAAASLQLPLRRFFVALLPSWSIHIFVTAVISLAGALNWFFWGTVARGAGC